MCRWNQLDLVIVLLSIMGITLEKIEEASLPINPTIIRIMRVLRIARGTDASLRCFRKVPPRRLSRKCGRSQQGRESTRWRRETHSSDEGVKKVQGRTDEEEQSH